MRHRDGGTVHEKQFLTFMTAPPQNYNAASNQTLLWVKELFENYHISEISYRFTCLLEMAVGSPLFIEQPPKKRAELVGDTVYILRYLDNLATAYDAELKEVEEDNEPDNKD